MNDQQQVPQPAPAGAPQGPPGPPVAAPRSAGQGQAPAPARRGMRGNAKSMVISMIVVLALVLVWIAMVPRVSSVDQPVQDVAGIAREEAMAQHWDLAIVEGLPKGWQATNVTLMRSAKPVTWQAGYTGPGNAYAAVVQTRHGGASWIASHTGSGARVGTVSIAGATWVKYRKDSNSQNSLVRQAPLAGLSTVVTGTVSWPQLQRFAAHVVPYSRSAAAKKHASATR